MASINSRRSCTVVFEKARKRFFRGCHGFVHIVLIAHHDLTDDLLIGRIDDVKRLRIARIHPLTINIKFQTIFHFGCKCGQQTSQCACCRMIESKFSARVQTEYSAQAAKIALKP